MANKEFEEKQKTIKIFEMNGCDWYAAETAQDALEAIAGNIGYGSVAEYREDYSDIPRELSDEEMEKLIFTEDDDETGLRNGTKKSFRQKLDEMILAKEEFPTMFASTEY